MPTGPSQEMRDKAREASEKLHRSAQISPHVKTGETPVSGLKAKAEKTAEITKAEETRKAGMPFISTNEFPTRS